MTSDGYLVLRNFSDLRVQNVMNFLKNTLGQRLTNFKLNGFEVSPDGNQFRLKLEVLPLSTQIHSLYQKVILVRSGSGYEVVESGYG